MPALIIEIRDACVTALNTAAAAHEFAEDFVAAGVILPRWKLPELSQRKVSFVASDDSGSRSTRGSWEHEQTVQVLVQKAIAVTTPPTVTAQEQAHLLLMQQLMDWFEEHNPAENLAALIEVKWAPLFLVSDLEQNNTLSSVISLVFRSWRT